MAAITKRLLHLRPSFHFHSHSHSHSHARPHPYPLHHFSSSSDPDNPQPDPDSEAQTGPSFSSSFNEVKASLQQRPPPQNRRQTPRPPPQTAAPSGADSAEAIRRQLSEFRIRSAAPPPPSSSGQYVSLQELYERNVNPKGDGAAAPSGFDSGGQRSFDGVRDKLRQLSPNRNDSGGKLSDRWSLSRFAENLKLKADQNANQDPATFTGGGDSFIPSFLRRETAGKGGSNLGSTGFRTTDFGRSYDHQDLGKKLKMVRPETRKGKWFSLQELSDRLAKVREADEKNMSEKFGGLNVVKDLRAGIEKVKQFADEKAQKRPMQSIDLFGSIGRTQRYLGPPKNDLVEKYFHPDNMSSAEKLKLELKKVRDEFKMSESDCGSARVQVAQLTTKIKHLSNVLQKKDKHSRRGLQAMVQRRKKLLKYLRRTDWDSYCLVLSKLGLRDNPDIKA